MAGRDYYSLKLKKFLPVALGGGVEGYFWLYFGIACFFPSFFKIAVPEGICAMPSDFLAFYGLEENGWLIADCFASHLVAFSLLMLSVLVLCALILLRFFGCMSFSGLLNGVELVSARDGERVGIKAGLKFILLRPGMIGFALVGLVFLVSGGTIHLYIAIKIIFLAVFVSLIISLFDFFSQQELTFIERISGTRFILSHNGKKYWDEKAPKMRQGWRRFWHGTCFYASAIIYIAWGILLGVIVFNLMREPLVLNTPETLAVYDRPAPIWDNNLAAAIAGLVAPQDIEDSYEYGREKSAFYINVANKTKDVLGILSHTDVPEALVSKHSLLREKDEISSFIENGGERLDCSYNMNVMADREKCPSGDSVNIQGALNLNQTLCNRFQKLPSYKEMSVLDDRYPWGVFLPLAQAEAAYILSLQKQGRREMSVAAWRDFMFVYDKVVRGTRNIVEKITAYVVYGVHIQALESLLLNDPSIARFHGDELLEALTLRNVRETGSENMMLSEWAFDSLPIYMDLGVSPALNKVKLECVEKNKGFSAMSPAEFFAEPERDLCPNFYSVEGQDVLTWSLSQPGFFVTNIMQLLFVRDDDLYSYIKFSHDIVSKADLARAAIYILKDDVAEDQIAETLKTMKTERPIVWDTEKKWLYVRNPYEEGDVPNLKFRLNLERKVQ